MIELLPDVHSALAGLGPYVHHLAAKRLLLTGARGFLGRYVVALLVEANRGPLKQTPCEVTAVDSLLTGASDRTEWRNLPGITFMQQNVQRGIGTIPDKLDFVLHLAGIASPHWYKQLPLETIDVAVEGSKQMLELAKEHDARYLFTSSSEVYQTALVVPTPEAYVGSIPSMTDRSCYDVSKLLGETLAYVYSQKYGVDTVTLRIYNSFGAGMSEADKRILPSIAAKVVADEEITVYGTAGRSLPRRTYTPVANTLLGLFLVLLRGASGEVYNVGLDTPEIDVPELIERIRRVTGREVRYRVRAPPEHYATEPLRRCPDITKLKGLGFQPVVDLDEGLRRFMGWALSTYTGAA